MPAGVMEAQRPQEIHQLRSGRLIDGELQELDAIECRQRRARSAPSEASASVKISERSPSRATNCAGAARKSSLNTSSDNGPA